MPQAPVNGAAPSALQARRTQRTLASTAFSHLTVTAQPTIKNGPTTRIPT